LGLSIADAVRIASKRGVELPSGAYVGRVNPTSSAALAGIRPGDVVTQLAGQPIHTDQDVHRVMADVHYDEMVELLVWRSGQTIGKRVRV
jgi:S1-C subfamily serine protease